MATKSFITEFKFSAKSGAKLISAIESSTTHEHVVKQPVSIIEDKDAINNIIDSFNKKGTNK